jgi:hypothetical protein
MFRPYLVSAIPTSCFLIVFKPQAAGRRGRNRPSETSQASDGISKIRLDQNSLRGIYAKLTQRMQACSSARNILQRWRQRWLQPARDATAGI